MGGFWLYCLLHPIHTSVYVLCLIPMQWGRLIRFRTNNIERGGLCFTVTYKRGRRKVLDTLLQFCLLEHFFKNAACSVVAVGESPRQVRIVPCTTLSRRPPAPRVSLASGEIPSTVSKCKRMAAACCTWRVINQQEAPLYTSYQNREGKGGASARPTDIVPRAQHKRSGLGLTSILAPKTVAPTVNTS